MKRHGISPPFIVPVLLLASLLQGGLWYRNYHYLTPPAVVGWNWDDHPRTVLIYYASSKGCACSVDLEGSVGKAVSAQAEVVVLAEPSVIKQMELKEVLTEPHVSVLPTTSVTRPFWRDYEKTETILVKEGRIKHRLLGTMWPDSFLSK